MTNPVTKRSNAIRGIVAVWTGQGDAVEFPTASCPIVLLPKPPKSAVLFEGSLDGEVFAPIRDADGMPVRLTREGVYQLPFPVSYLRPLVGDDATVVHVFVQGDA